VRYATGTYQLSPQLDLWADARDFDASLNRSRQTSGDTAVRALEHAIALYRAPLLVDVPWLWADGARSAYQSRFIRAALTLAGLLAGTGETERADALAERVLEIDPSNEEAYERLLHSARGRGDQVAARRLAGELRLAMASGEIPAKPYAVRSHPTRPDPVQLGSPGRTRPVH
jgi:DNA-binding SARP family transcriptional activator